MKNLISLEVCRISPLVGAFVEEKCLVKEDMS